MKAFLALFLIAALNSASIAQQKIITDPIKYNDYIVASQNDIMLEMLKFNELMSDSTNTLARSKAQIQVMIELTKKAIKTTQNLKPLDKDFNLRNTAIDLFGFYEKAMQVDYINMVEEIFKPAPDYNRLQEILKGVTEAEKGFDEAFQTAQKNFADYYDIELTENDLNKKLEGN